MFNKFPLRYLFPNSITAASIVLACASIVYGHLGNYEFAAWLIVWSVLLDKADGFAAKLADARSSFGVQFDSLADLVAFCIAPAMLVYCIFTSDPRYAAGFSRPLPHGLLVLTTVAYALCGAIRLAHFNVTTEEIGNAWFHGLSTTISGAIVATFYLTSQQLLWPSQVVMAMPVLMLVLAVLMISNLWLPKSLGRFSKILFPVFIFGAIIVYTLGFMRLYPQLLLGLAVLYPLIGFPVGYIARRNAS